MKIAKGMRVKIDYEIAIDGGEVIETSTDRGPLDYIHGGGTLLPSLEHRMDGMVVGDEKSGLIPASEYQDESSLPEAVLPRSEFPEGDEIEVGKRFEAKDADGAAVNFTVLEIDGDNVKVRYGGKDLRFRVKILEVGDASVPPPIPS